MNVSEVDSAALQLIVDGFSEGVFAESVAWAKDMLDQPLLEQLSCASHIVKVMQSMAQSELLLRSCGGLASLAQRRINADQVKCVKKLRAQMSALRTFAARAGEDIFAARVGGGIDFEFHLQTLCGTIETASTFASALEESNRILGFFSSSWSKDIDELLLVINNSCPDWSPQRDTILSHPAVITSLLTNPTTIP
jgi:hypothetical protein